MSYQVLARKWRPQTFADVVGQQHVLTALANSLTLGRIHHAYLFSGTRGVGKTSIARLLAKGLNCETGITATPCGVCSHCREIEQGRFIDLIEIDAASRTKVEDTRELLDNVQYAPARGRFKIYLIDEVHMLSRHSFNALLKTLEEPPEHVKFLLATTDPQKLPITVLSRCLQFHLKALDSEQIQHQLEHILTAENVTFEPRALPLLARAADGSLRDALSLTDQAIASGNGHISYPSVSAMLGTLDDNQALLLLEALVMADGERVMAGVSEVASRGVEWEALLVGMQSLLHQIAMIQLSTSALAPEMTAAEGRIRELARTIPPTDVQLYYQTLLIGRKELPYAPDRRMGVEMTLLRALAFHPEAPLPEPQASSVAAEATVSASPPVSSSASADVSDDPVLPSATSQVLAARSLLQQRQGETAAKKSDPVVLSRERPKNTTVQERLHTLSGHAVVRPAAVEQESDTTTKEPYRWKATTHTETVKQDIATPKALKKALEHEKTAEMVAKLASEAAARDSWAAEISQLTMPKLVEQVALNAWKEQEGNRICLHLRSGQQHLNTADTRKKLAQALSTFSGTTVELTVVADDNPAMRTPQEWRQAIYEEKLAQAREAIMADNNIQMLRRFFDADLDEDSIRPI